MKALSFGLALMLVATTAWGQEPGRPVINAFRVSWQSETDRVAQRIQGRVHNDSPFRVTDVRLQVEGLDVSNRPLGRTFTWAIGDIPPGGDSSFVTEAMPGAVAYRMSVV